MPATRTSRRKKSTAKQVSEIPETSQEPEQEVAAEAAEQFVDRMTGTEKGSNSEDNESGNGNDGQGGSEAGTPNGSDVLKLTMEERKAKLAQLRKKIVRLFVILHFLLSGNPYVYLTAFYLTGGLCKS
jgi:pre-mRNA-splicing factor SYF2